MEADESREIEEVEAAAKRIVETLRLVGLMLNDRGDDIFQVSRLGRDPTSALQVARIKNWNSVLAIVDGALNVVNVLQTGAGDLMDGSVDRFVLRCDVAIEGIRTARVERIPPDLTDQVREEIRSLGITMSQELEIFFLNGFLGPSGGLSSLSEGAQAEALRIAGRLSPAARAFFQDHYLKPSKRHSGHEKNQ